MDIDRSLAIGGALGDSLPNNLIVVSGAHGGSIFMLELAARLSLRGALYMLDCGNRSNMYRVARTLRFLTSDPVAMLENIRLSRAFTCYQVVSLLERLPCGVGAPILILDLLATFMDESVHVDESAMLFKKALERLLLLAHGTPIVVGVKPLLSLSLPRFGLLEQLKTQAFQVWEEGSLALTHPEDVQLPLFADY